MSKVEAQLQVGDDHYTSEAARARSLANLRPWQPGQSGNPAGRPAAGASLREYLNELDVVDADGKPRYSDADLKQMVDDQTVQRSKRRAAAIWLRSGKRGFHEKSGRTYAGEDLDRIADRTEGLPIKRVEMSVETVTKPADLASDAIALIRQDPRLIRPLWPRLLAMTRYAPTIREQLRPILQQHAPDLAAALDTVDTTARALPPADST